MARTAVASASLRARRGFRPNRNHLALLVIVVIAIWFVFAFARTITQISTAGDRQAQLALEAGALSDRLAADHQELRLVQTDAFQALQARSYGIGKPGEIAFSVGLDETPPHVAPLGSDAVGLPARTPLDAWLSLLFGD